MYHIVELVALSHSPVILLHVGSVLRLVPLVPSFPADCSINCFMGSQHGIVSRFGSCFNSLHGWTWEWSICHHDDTRCSGLKLAKWSWVQGIEVYESACTQLFTGEVYHSQLSSQHGQQQHRFRSLNISALASSFGCWLAGNDWVNQWFQQAAGRSREVDLGSGGCAVAKAAWIFFSGAWHWSFVVHLIVNAESDLGYFFNLSNRDPWCAGFHHPFW